MTAGCLNSCQFRADNAFRSDREAVYEKNWHEFRQPAVTKSWCIETRLVYRKDTGHGSPRKFHRRCTKKSRVTHSHVHLGLTLNYHVRSEGYFPTKLPQYVRSEMFTCSQIHVHFRLTRAHDTDTITAQENCTVCTP